MKVGQPTLLKVQRSREDKLEWVARSRTMSHARMERTFTGVPSRSSIAKWAAGEELGEMGRPPILPTTAVATAVADIKKVGGALTAASLEYALLESKVVSGVGEVDIRNFGAALRRRFHRSVRPTTTKLPPDPAEVEAWQKDVIDFISDCPLVKNRSAKCEHEATTSKISDDQLFYCRSRGIPQEDAVALIVSGFCREVMEELPMEFAVEARKLLGISLEGSVG